MAGATGSEDREVQSVGGTGPAVAFEEAVATPWLVDLSHVVMCIAMGFMLLLMT